MKINNRRYTGSKYKLMPWIKDLILKHCPEHDSLFDVFGGTGVVSASLLDITQKTIINDFLYSNEVIYEAFFSQEPYSSEKLNSYVEKYTSIDVSRLEDNYVSLNYGGKYFRYDDSKLIGFIREDIEVSYHASKLNKHEYTILLASLLFSFDRCANTVGHYEAYIKGKEIRTQFVFELIEPIKTDNDISIYRTDSNELARTVSADVAFIDPPYNSRQYSRFYHVLETIVKWDKPVLYGTAMKPAEENMSGYTSETTLETVFDYNSAYSTHVREILNILYPSVQINIINSGISGDNAINGLTRIDRDVLSYHPDLVVVGFALNDSCVGESGLENYYSVGIKR